MIENTHAPGHRASTPDDPLRRANALQFDCATYISGYQRSDVRHVVRIEEAVGLLARHTGAGAAGAPRVLDIGNGGGITTEALLGRGMEVIAGDIVTSGLRTVDPRAHRVQFDASKPFPVKDRSLDAILAGDLVHMLFDPAAFLRECRRVLKPDGMLVVTTLNLAGLQDRLRFLLGRSPFQIDPLHAVLRLHIRPFTFSALEAVLRSTGWRPVVRKSNHLVLRWGSRKVFVRWPAVLCPSLGNALVVGAVPDGSGAARE